MGGTYCGWVAPIVDGWKILSPIILAASHIDATVIIKALPFGAKLA